MEPEGEGERGSAGMSALSPSLDLEGKMEVGQVVARDAATYVEF